LLQRYFTEPYRFIPPYRSTFWCRLARRPIRGHLRRRLGVPRWHFEGLDFLRDSLGRGAGVLVTANHCRWSDPVVLGLLGLEVQRYFYYVVSYHLFKQSRLMGWWMNRIGGYSIWREGADREALRASAAILAEARRPLVLFPEGTWFRQNDRLGPLQEGVALIARQAARLSDRPVLVHPVAIKYWVLEDPRPELRRRLERLEARLGWHAQHHLELVPRVEKLGAALLAVKEIEHFGRAGPGPLDERIQLLASSHVSALERAHLGKEYDGWILERIRRLRQPLARRLVETGRGAGDLEGARATRRALDTLLFCENLSSHSQEYLRERPSPERLTETVQRIEETVTDLVEEPIAPLGAAVAVGPALDARAFPPARGQADALVPQLAGAIQGLLDRLLAQGPPPDWNCPPSAVSPQPSALSSQRSAPGNRALRGACPAGEPLTSDC
jgi:1-acyl-sn-glycerol-3-phosphate acyltransferase